ncbi:ornithine cyclodeaminase [Amycolatopsis sp. WAC 01416]|uniref:ornithine cyclodeaminase family protein n=1 Tax=Amycolatopsis sp. WAC 01416 TaxID=2203196 RepID=UPI000F79DD4C|nr:ornithine cyclodeaminase family protein [Amycolatopsis sp. WAC 01416]RSN34592.1 ornithine cyclodeaminase [Amycolatopsis sp. WAC 01416]
MSEQWYDQADTGLAGAGRVTVLSRADVRRCLATIDPVEIVRRTLADHDRGESLLPAEAYLRWENSQGAYTRSIGMPGAVGPHHGMKIINASVSNPAAGLERAGGLGLCFDAETARVTSIMEAGLLSAVRTAAVSAVGVDVTGFADAGSLAIVGCGAQGRMHAALLTRRLPSLRAVSLHDRDPAVAHRLADLLSRDGLEVTVYDKARDAVAAGEIAVFTTTADEGYVTPDWARPGALLVNVSLGDLADETFLDAAALYVDDLDLVADNPRRPLGRLMRDGLVTRPSDGTAKPIDATLGGLLTGRYPSRGTTRPHVVLNPFGMGVLDVALYGAIASQARHLGFGSLVDLG